MDYLNSNQMTNGYRKSVAGAGANNFSNQYTYMNDVCVSAFLKMSSPDFKLYIVYNAIIMTEK